MLKHKPMAVHLMMRQLLAGKTTPFQIMSDLHLEVGQQYLTFQVPPTAPCLVLAGDIGQLSNYDLYLSFLCLQCEQFLRVFLVLGNHEFFGMSHDEGLCIADRLEKGPVLAGRLVVLHRRRYDLEEQSDITVLGCTLWSRVHPGARDIVESKVKDFRRIQDWGVDKHNEEHVKDVEWLQEQIGLIRKEPNGDKRRIIAVTHHAPSTQQTSKPSDINNPWTSAFASDLVGLKDTPVLSEVQWWIFGHTHYSTHFTKDGVKVVSNQRGYSLPQTTDHTAPTAIRKSFGSDLITSISGGLISRRGQNQSAFDDQKIINV